MRIKQASKSMSLSNKNDQKYYDLNQRVFKKLAPFYNCFVSLISKLRHEVVRITNAIPNSLILDVATGTGAQAFAFGKKGYNVTGIDISEAMLKVAMKNNKSNHVHFEIADATSLRFADGSFDVVTISFALHDMPMSIREKVLKEMYRVAKPGAIITIVDYSLPQNRWIRFLIYNLIKLYEGEYYVQFIHSDLPSLLKQIGITVQEEKNAIWGAARILKGSKK